VVEVIIHKDAEVKYSTVQNWFPGDGNTGGFQVIAEPVSDCVQDILLFSPSHSARLVTKFRIPPRG
jgi:Fe-S cluster assembly scaffold protein SufB